eukprot:6182496-Pleurochrysis_carterae.AAC.3
MALWPALGKFLRGVHAASSLRVGRLSVSAFVCCLGSDGVAVACLRFACLISLQIVPCLQKFSSA